MCKCLEWLFGWCCHCCTSDEPHEVVIRKSKNNRKTLSKISSPSELDVYDLTTVHKSKVDKNSLNQLLAQNGYQLEEQIGGGNYSSVFKATVIVEHKGLVINETIACKVVDISDNKRMTEVKNELFILETIKHPNIIKMYEHFIVDKHRLYIFMAYTSGGDLGRHLKHKGPFDEDMCRKWFIEIVNGVMHLHEKKIAHRDLKLQNILLNNDMMALITDFGLSQVSYRSDRPGRKGGVQWSRSFCGTLPYMSPEIIANIDNTLYYDPFAADVWSLGVILFVLYNKTYPFDPQNTKTMLSKMKKMTLQWNKTRRLTKGFKSIICCIFQVDPYLRVKCSELLAHPWVKNENRDLLMTTEFSNTSTH